MSIEARLRLEAYIELAAARFTLRIDLIAGARGRDAATQMLFLGVDFTRHGVAGAASAGAVRIAALHHEVRHHAMKRESVVETLLGQSLEVFHGLGRDLRIQLDDEGAFVGIDDCVMAGVSHSNSIQFGLTGRGRRH